MGGGSGAALRLLLALTLNNLQTTARSSRTSRSSRSATSASFPLASIDRLPDLYWNTSNPIFHISNTDHIIDVIQGSSPAPKINIICPLTGFGGHQEQHVIYSVDREEFTSCRILRPQPRIVAYCTRGENTKMFTISFRSFSPMPNVLEFLPGKDYYFISTSSPSDLHSRVGGYCQSHNMKVVFKVISQQPSLTGAGGKEAVALVQEEKGPWTQRQEALKEQEGRRAMEQEEEKKLGGQEGDQGILKVLEEKKEQGEQEEEKSQLPSEHYPVFPTSSVFNHLPSPLLLLLLLPSSLVLLPPCSSLLPYII